MPHLCIYVSAQYRSNRGNMYVNMCVFVCSLFLCPVHGNRKIQCNHLYLSLIHPVDYFFPFFHSFFLSVSFEFPLFRSFSLSFRLCSFARLRFPFESISSKRALTTFAFLYKRKHTHIQRKHTHTHTQICINKYIYH